jgi:hypothetical protein
VEGGDVVELLESRTGELSIEELLQLREELDLVATKSEADSVIKIHL